MSIHPTAIISPGAELDASVEVGPYSVVGPHVRIGAGTVLRAHVVLDGHTTIGRNNTFYPFVAIGNEPQHLHYAGEPTKVLIGDRNAFREGSTVHRGTVEGGGVTKVGDDGLFMAYTHVAHDCQVGNRVVICNCAALGGHVVVGDGAFLSGLCAVHQFSRVGTLAMVSGGAMAAKDVPPYCIAQGDRARLVGLNVVGMKRAGIPPDSIKRIKRAYHEIFDGELSLNERLDKIVAEHGDGCPEVRVFAEFCRSSKRGICVPRNADIDGVP